MRVIVAGLGVQGHKRRAVAGGDVVATVDPVADAADYRSVADVPADSYDAALVCTPDEAKIELVSALLNLGKHVLVEKPMVAPDSGSLRQLAEIARHHNVACYTAYNHRFEPHFMRMKELIVSGWLGEIYSVRMFYGNGTARLVRSSPWRDHGAGVLPDLGSHLLDTALYWLGDTDRQFELWSANCFENKTMDQVSFGCQGRPLIQLEATLLSWRNHFYADVFAENGSAHIHSLCKWGTSTFTRRRRVLPSGRPEEETVPLPEGDPTWEAEYDAFKALCETGGDNLDNDIWINDVLNRLAADAGVEPAPEKSKEKPKESKT